MTDILKVPDLQDLEVCVHVQELKNSLLKKLHFFSMLIEVVTVEMIIISQYCLTGDSIGIENNLIFTVCLVFSALCQIKLSK